MWIYPPLNAPRAAGGDFYRHCENRFSVRGNSHAIIVIARKSQDLRDNLFLFLWITKETSFCHDFATQNLAMR
ncbi:hypothetical protein [Helicobacter macacae]|uniref:hypothetical protein n=1 Tax=Helicobacter macacae TaxID=398626 RepID=UPI0004031422|nr:hypothetical protein [Helicobacter macacae]